MLLRLWIQQNKLNNQNGLRFVWEVNSNTNYNTYCNPPECENPIHPTCIPFRKYPKLLLLDTRSNPNSIQGDCRTICLFMYTVYIITGIGETSSCVCHLRGAANCDNSRGIVHSYGHRNSIQWEGFEIHFEPTFKHKLRPLLVIITQIADYHCVRDMVLHFWNTFNIHIVSY